MINTLTGTITHISDQHITLDVQGVGYALSICDVKQCTIGQKNTFFTYMHWNQENGPTLYGFCQELEKTVFLLIISCSGIGPKIGLNILSQIDPLQFLEIVQLGNEEALSAINGIGAKKAEQLIMHLKHKVAKLLEKSEIAVGGSTSLESRHNIGQVLKSLNYSKQEITNALHYLNDNYPAANIPFDQLMRHALGYLAKKI